jgi:DNA-directed RNA polymerase specialized sigma24 family protein
MPGMFPIRDRRTNEELFFDHYAQLLKWALQLCRLDRNDAEDLVQDFYLQITHINVALADVDDLEPYLFRILRNLLYSRLRRQGGNRGHELSMVDFNSVEQGLAAVHDNDLVFVHADLKRICEFACERKARSRAACVFILRFFLGYYSSEVMKIAHLTRMGVDRALQVARSEARSYFGRPNMAPPSLRRSRERVRISKNCSGSHRLFLELRQAIFDSCQGSCFEHAALKEHYTAEPPARFTVAQLAHLVSCKNCLDRVNAILGLPPLDERSPDDTIGRDNPPGAGAGEGSRFTVTRGKKPDADAMRCKALERKKRELFEHRPENLELAVNGETRTTQRITAEMSELKLTLNRAEEPGFIEIFGDQGIRLAYLHVVGPTSSPDLTLRQHVPLSDGRSLDLALSFATDLPTVHVVYTDPVFVQAAEEDDEETLFVVSPDTCVPTDTGGRANFAVGLPHHATTFLEADGHVWWAKVSAQFRRCLDLAQLQVNPLFASALVLALASAVCFFFWWRGNVTMTAGALLDRAQAHDPSVQTTAQPGVIFQKIRIKTSARTTERTLYRDAQHRRRLRQHALDEADSKLEALLAQAGVDCNDPLSAAGYRSWHDRQGIESDSVKRIAEDRLILTTNVTTNYVLSESLTVRESDFHVVGRTVTLRDEANHADSASTTIEIAELNYDILPWGAVNGDQFEPVSDVPAMHAAIHLPRMLSDLELDEAELTARVALNQLHADTSEPIQLTRTTKGIDVKGVVDTDIRKQEIVSRLARLPNVRVSILSAEEIGTRAPLTASVGGDQPIHIYSVEAQPSPLEQYLRANHLEVNQLAQISHTLLDESLAISQAEVHLGELQSRFNQSTLLSSESRAQLTALTQTYIETIRAGLALNQRALVSLGFGSIQAAQTESHSSDTNGQPSQPLALLATPATQTSSNPSDNLGDAPTPSFGPATRHYRELCLELVSNPTGQPRPATEIARDLADTGAKILEHLETLSHALLRDHNGF